MAHDSVYLLEPELVEEGIESISLNFDTVVSTIITVAETERRFRK